MIRRGATVEVYRGHEIMVLDGDPKSALIVERWTGIPLPTKVTALPDEEESACLLRARELVNLYVELLRRPRAGDQSRTL